MAANNYCTLDDVKQNLPDGNWGTSYDAFLSGLIERASREIDRFTKRKPGAYYVSADVTRYFNGSGKTELWIDELAAVPTTVAVAETGLVDSSAGTGGTYTTWAATDYYCWPYNALDDGVPFLKLVLDHYSGTKTMWYAFPRSVKIVGRFGYSTMPTADVKGAVTTQAARWFKRAQQAYQDTGAVVELGQLTYTKKLDPSVEVMIDHLRRLTI